VQAIACPRRENQGLEKRRLSAAAIPFVDVNIGSDGFANPSRLAELDLAELDLAVPNDTI
jgi:hypothetical protein